MANYPDYNNTEYSHYEKFHDPREHNVVDAIKKYGQINPNQGNPNDEEVQIEELTKALRLLLHSQLGGLSYADSGHTGFSPALTTLTGYDATKNQVLKNVKGVLTWVEETGYDATKTQTLKNVTGTTTWVDDTP